MQRRIFFPYAKIRKGQHEIIEKLLEVLDKRMNAVFEAPSGIGKTIAVLSVVVPYAIEHDLKVFYMCRTHTQMSRVIEELNSMRKKGYEVSGIMLRGKSEMCLLESLRRLPYKIMVKLCETYKAKGMCPYHLAFKQESTERLLETLKGGIHHADRLYKLGKELGICPHELSLEVAKRSRVIALSYLYLLDSDLRKVLLINMDKTLDQAILIFDEAHNVIEVAQEVESISITTKDIESVLTSIKEIKVGKVARNREEFEEFSKYKYAVVRALKVMRQLLLEKSTREEKLYSAKEFITDFELKTRESLLIVMDYLERLVKTAVLRRRRPRNMLSIEEFIDFLNKLIDTTYDERYVHVLSHRGDTVIYSVYCIDPQVAIKPIVEDSFITIHMSATLSPISHYVEICGIPKSVEFKVRPVYAGRVKALIVEGLTTAYEERSEEMYSRIADFLSEITSHLDCNTAIFFPSYEVMNEVFSRMKHIEKPIFVERRGESTREIEEKIKKFKECWRSGGGLLLGVLGGRTCEGVDYPGRELEVEIIVGVPYPEPSLTTYAQMKYYEAKYGKERAFEYVYKVPAMRKVNQAIGRLVRGPDDYGVVLLVDSRYKALMEYLVDWINILGTQSYERTNRILESITSIIRKFRQLT
ncbi:MAG: hypothetical protein DRZ82_01245 [Thermoprotei archaeon]|nr:MAG: hypothetical protein DRZ82_01245 [Thermoprotei archaeon]